MLNDPMIRTILTGAITSVLAVILTKARALVGTKAGVAAVLNVLGGVALALSGEGTFDATTLAKQIAAVALASLAWWKTTVQPSIEANAGPVALLHRRTAGFGVG